MSEKDPKKEEIKKDYRTKSQKFRELAEKRVNKVLTGLRLIENLSNKITMHIQMKRLIK